MNRKLASVRAFFNYLIEAGLIKVNPTANIKSPKIERKKLDYLEIEEIDRLLAVPDDSVKGIRDRAILEVLYATGIRVSELIEANVDDINLRMGFITCDGEQSRPRIVPLGRPSRAALENYIYDSRTKLIKDNTDEPALFVNYSGKRITRQGLWKILKEYGVKAGIDKKLTPNIIRTSFAVHMLQNGADLKSLAGADGARRHHGDSGVPVGNEKQDQGRIRQVAPESVAALPADVRSGIPAQWSYSSDATAARYGGVKLQLSGMLMFFGSFRDVREKVLEPCTCSVV